MHSGKILGAYKLIRLFITDIGYRRSGKGQFLIEICYILFNSKSKRVRLII